jgi:hypothetical protein
LKHEALTCFGRLWWVCKHPGRQPTGFLKLPLAGRETGESHRVHPPAR